MKVGISFFLLLALRPCQGEQGQGWGQGGQGKNQGDQGQGQGGQGWHDQGQGGGGGGGFGGNFQRMRHRVLMDYFPGCFDEARNSTDDISSDTYTTVTQTFVQCMQQRGDQRCLTNETVVEIQTCLDNRIGLYYEHHNNSNGNGNGNGNGYGNGQNRFLQYPGNGQGQDHSNGQGDNGNHGGMFQQGGGTGQGGQGMGSMMNQSDHQGQQGMMDQGDYPGQQGMMMYADEMMNAQGSRLLRLVGNCTSDYMVCARDNLQNDVTNLPNCVQQSMRNLAVTVAENRNACLDTCRGSGENWTQPTISRGLLHANRLGNCNGIRNAFFHPVCHRLSCCPATFNAMASLGDCIVNDVLHYLPDNCTSTCSAAAGDGQQNATGRRELSASSKTVHRRSLQGTTTLPPTSTDYENYIYNECVELAPGVSQYQRSEQELAARGGDFYDCVVSQVYTVMEDDGSIVANNGNEPTAGGGSTTSSSSSSRCALGVTSSGFYAILVGLMMTLEIVFA